jgi:hypothetical protein
MLLFFWNLVMRLFWYLAAISRDLRHCLTGIIQEQTKSQKTGVRVLLDNKLRPFHWVLNFFGLILLFISRAVIGRLKSGP